MRKLVIVRHAEAYYTGELKKEGLGILMSTSRYLKEIVGESSVEIICSSSRRALNTAELIKKVLFTQGVILGYSELWSDIEHSENLERALTIINKHSNAEILIVVTHLEYAEDFLQYYILRKFGKHIDPTITPKGEAWICNCEDGKIHPIPE